MNEQLCSILEPMLGSDLNPDECQCLGNLGSTRELKDGETLIEEGQVDNSLHLVLHGNLAVIRQTGGGEPITLHVLHRGDLAGALGFVDGQPHSATLRGLGSTWVFSLERGQFESLLDSQPRLLYHTMRAIVRGVHETLRRMNLQQVELTNYITRQHGRY